MGKIGVNVLDEGEQEEEQSTSGEDDGCTMCNTPLSLDSESSVPFGGPEEKEKGMDKVARIKEIDEIVPEGDGGGECSRSNPKRQKRMELQDTIILDENDDNSISTSTTPYPLKSIHVQATIVYTVAEVQITKVFTNDEEKAIHIVHYFPMDHRGGVTHIRAETDGKVYKGNLILRKEVKPALEQGSSEEEQEVTEFAFTGEQIKPDIFKINLGPIPPGQFVKVVVSYVTEVRIEPMHQRLEFYVPLKSLHLYESGHDLLEVPQLEDKPVPFSCTMVVSYPGLLKAIRSSNHLIDVEDKGEIPAKPLWHKMVIQVEQVLPDEMSDFVLHLVPEEKPTPLLYSESLRNGSTAIMLQFIPNFILEEQKVELIIAVDHSDSMKGENAELVKEVLKGLLLSLPVDCYFNILCFGNKHKFLFCTGSRKLCKDTLKEGRKFVKGFSFDIGETELRKPLEEIYDMPLLPGCSRQILIITNGAVKNGEDLIGLVRRNAHFTRVFTLGIGRMASHYLLEELANAGHGLFTLVDTSSLAEKVSLQIKHICQPSIQGLKVNWKDLHGVSLKPRRNILECSGSASTSECNNRFMLSGLSHNHNVFIGSPVTVYEVFHGRKPSSIHVSMDSPSGSFCLNLRIKDQNEIGNGDSKLLHRLIAIKCLREIGIRDSLAQFYSRPMKESERIRIRIEATRIAMANVIVNKYTILSSGNYLHNAVDNGSDNIRVIPPLSAVRNTNTRQAKDTATFLNDLKDLETPASFSTTKNKQEAMNINSIEEMDVDDHTDNSYALDNNILTKLQSLQSEDGSFQLTKTFANTIGWNLGILKDARNMNIHKNWEWRGWATALAVCFMTKKRVKGEEWTALLKKSGSYLTFHHPLTKDDMISTASNIF